MAVAVLAENAPQGCPGGLFEGPPCETAVFCPSDAERDPIKINRNYCPEDTTLDPVTTALPLGLIIRVGFDELLDPAIETLTEVDGILVGDIVPADPFTLECGGTEIAYEGWYDPSGNAFSAPIGPSLVITPAEAVATGATCTVTLNASITDKDGNAVPQDQRGPYEFTIGELAVVATSPADMAEGVDPSANIQVVFNNLIDVDSLAGNITVTDGTNTVTATLTVSADDGTIVVIDPDGPLIANTTYTVTVGAGVADVGGGALAADYMFSFTTGDLMEPDGGPGGDVDAGLGDAG